MTYQKIGFPTIDVSKPRGSYRVSTVDDHERETRRWLKQSLQALSGYPEVDTVGVIGWTTGTRPHRSPNGNYLLGYNTTTQSLELVAEDGSVANISKAFNLYAHPVGTIYETTDVSFNPNVTWGGTWELMDDGRFLLSSDENHAVGSIGGVEEVTLSTQEIPSHRHLHTHQHAHSRGTFVIPAEYPNTDGGGDYIVSIHKSGASGALTVNIESIGGHTSYDDTQGGEYTGGGQAHTNMPPYRVVKRWHRIA